MCLLCKHEDLTSNLQHICKNEAWQHAFISLSLARDGHRRKQLALIGQLSLAKLISIRFNEKPCLRKWGEE